MEQQLKELNVCLLLFSYTNGVKNQEIRFSFHFYWTMDLFYIGNLSQIIWYIPGHNVK